MKAPLDTLPTPLVALDAQACIVASNAAAERLLGAVDGEPFLSVVVDFDQAPARDALSSPGATRAFAHLLTRRGEIVPAELAISSADDDGVRFVHVTDTRERLESEREYELRAGTLAFVAELSGLFASGLDTTVAFDRAITVLREYIPHVAVAIGRTERDGRVRGLVAARDVSPTTLAELLSARVLYGGHVEEAHVANIASHFPAPSQTVVRGLSVGAAPVGVAVFYCPSPWSEGALALVELASRSFAVALTTAEANESARALEAERTLLLDAIPLWVFRLDANTSQTIYANGAIERALRVSGDEIFSSGIESMLLDARERELFDSARREALAHGQSPWVDLRFRSPASKIAVLRTRLYRISDARRETAVVEGIAQDVTDELETRTQLVHTDRLASLGALAAGVAHEINNPAAFILLGTQQLARMLQQLPTDERTSASRARMVEIVSDLNDGVQRIAQIVGELRLFARIPESAVSTPVDVNRVINSAITLTQAVLRARARVELDLGELPALPGDHARLGQVFVNLLVNAAQAIPPGADAEHCVRVETRESNGAIVVRVSDTGVGIRDEDLPRVFDPFYTTKGPGDGTGLGLTISMDLVRRAGGTIDVESRVGAGTTFTITLPVRLAHTASSAPPPSPVPSDPPAGARVLVVEDEQALAVALSRGLSPRFHVEHAADGVRAFERLSRDDAPFYHAVLCDLRIPGLDGRALYRAMRETRPEQADRFVFLTGGAIDEEHIQFLHNCGRPVLEKPFRIEELDAVLASVVTEPEATQ